VLKQIELYLDGELAGSLRAEVEEHLVGCDPCTGHAEFQLKLKEILRAKCGCREVPARVFERVRLLLEQHGHPS
jgi:mycothiol system anti-sigma-R factor